MENNELKNIWKTDANKKFKPFSEKELNDMIVNSAKKSMQRLHPKWLIGLGILCAAYLAWRIASGTFVSAFPIFYTVLLLILLGGLLARLWSSCKMNNYSADKPVKEWIRYRIHSIDNSLQFQKRYWIGLYILIIVCVAGSILAEPSGDALYLRIIVSGVTILLTLWIGIIMHKRKNKKLREVRDYLQRLYDGIGE